MYMNAPRTILTLGAALLLFAGLQGPVHGATSELATVSTTSGGIHWQPLVATDGWTLTVAGEERWIRSQFGPGESPAFQPADDSGQPLPDGSYTWELRAVYSRSGGDPNAAASGRDGTTNTSRTRAEPSGPHTQSGAFTILNGALAVDETETGMGAETGGTAATGGGSQEGFAVNDDLFVHSSACVGIDCVVNGESFGADTIRLKENNLRIHFLDTSNSGSFPSNDWRLVANDQANGGRNIFFLEDANSGREVFSVEAGAPSSSLYVDDGGRVGFGTSTPVVELHSASGDTPTLRLEQDGSSGFTPQTWDVAGNEANFFVRNVTAASRLPFRIFPAAPDDAIVVGAEGVGIGTDAPGAELDIRNFTSSSNTALWLTNNVTTWRLANSGSGRLVVSKVDSAGQEIAVNDRLDASGSTLIVQGSVEGTQFISTSSREVKTAFEALQPTNILDKVATLPVSAWRYVWEDASARHIGPVAEDFLRVFGLGDGKTISTVDADGVLMAAVQGLLQKMNDALAAKDAEIAALSARLQALEENTRRHGMRNAEDKTDLTAAH